MQLEPTSGEYFERMYRSNGDPWRFSESPYELSRYDSILSALEGRRYKAAFEPGCSIGVLTQKLAAVCTRVEAIDISKTAVAQARKRCANLPNVTISTRSMSEMVLRGRFDLILMSEIGYYFSEVKLRELVKMMLAHLVPSGTFLAGHWLGRSDDHILSGDRVHEILLENNELVHEWGERHQGFRLDRWLRR